MERCPKSTGAGDFCSLLSTRRGSSAAVASLAEELTRLKRNTSPVLSVRRM